MSVKIIVSYDGTQNEDDAIALGRLFAHAGAEVSLAYVRHIREPDSNRETLAQHEAAELLQRGVALFGDAHGAPVGTHVVTDRSTPEGLRTLAEQQDADAIVFCSDSHTAKGHIAVGNSAQRLLEGGQFAIAVAPAGLARAGDQARIERIVAVGDADGGALATAEALARAVDGVVEPVANDGTDLIVFDSRPEAEPGRIALSSSASHLIEIARSSVLVVPRGVALDFERAPAAVGA
ncbi:MAG TPA: universal stress protein [Solirubrobacteraceae bacterium]|jgi:nucleotide-binding universal stress UspA family protein|nr:universal stress protein [Solirubrobacteraceae bacterium]